MVNRPDHDDDMNDDTAPIPPLCAACGECVCDPTKPDERVRLRAQAAALTLRCDAAEQAAAYLAGQAKRDAEAHALALEAFGEAVAALTAERDKARADAETMRCLLDGRPHSNECATDFVRCQEDETHWQCLCRDEEIAGLRATVAARDEEISGLRAERDNEHTRRLNCEDELAEARKHHRAADAHCQRVEGWLGNAQMELMKARVINDVRERSRDKWKRRLAQLVRMAGSDGSFGGGIRWERARWVKMLREKLDGKDGG